MRRQLADAAFHLTLGDVLGFGQNCYLLGTAAMPSQNNATQAFGSRG